MWRLSNTIREIARRLARARSTISRELRRNAATRSGGFDYRATTAQWHADPGRASSEVGTTGRQRGATDVSQDETVRAIKQCTREDRWVWVAVARSFPEPRSNCGRDGGVRSGAREYVIGRDSDLSHHNSR